MSDDYGLHRRMAMAVRDLLSENLEAALQSSSGEAE
jgi:hypothetical protein